MPRPGKFYIDFGPGGSVTFTPPKGLSFTVPPSQKTRELRFILEGSCEWDLSFEDNGYRYYSPQQWEFGGRECFYQLRNEYEF